MLSTWADLASLGESQAVVVLSKAHPPSASVMMELMIAAAAAGTAWPESEKLQGICTRPDDDVTASRFSWQQNISSIFLRHSRCRRIKENIDLLYQRIKRKKHTNKCGCLKEYNERSRWTWKAFHVPERTGWKRERKNCWKRIDFSHLEALN